MDRATIPNPVYPRRSRCKFRGRNLLLKLALPTGVLQERAKRGLLHDDKPTTYCTLREALEYWLWSMFEAAARSSPVRRVGMTVYLPRSVRFGAALHVRCEGHYGSSHHS